MSEPRFKPLFISLNGIEGWFRDQIALAIFGVPVMLTAWYMLYLLGFLVGFIEGFTQFSKLPNTAAGLNLNKATP